mmetsp:Transcript_30715/g.99004  ORF Transcript_30715/g.99004 Transcript_30715/m.99004 type:complete len:224 (-) Transcript_30715:321-992(-)
MRFNASTVAESARYAANSSARARRVSSDEIRQRLGVCVSPPRIFDSTILRRSPAKSSTTPYFWNSSKASAGDASIHSGNKYVYRRRSHDFFASNPFVTRTASKTRMSAGKASFSRATATSIPSSSASSSLTVTTCRAALTPLSVRADRDHPHLCSFSVFRSDTTPDDASLQRRASDERRNVGLLFLLSSSENERTDGSPRRRQQQEQKTHGTHALIISDSMVG